MSSINAYNEIGETPLTMAVKSNLQGSISQLLKEDGIDVNKKNLDDDTALMIAVIHNVDAIPILLQDPCIDVNILNKFQETALNLSAKYSPKAFEYLMQCAYIDINKRNIYGRTALMIACIHQPDLVEKLLKYPHLDINSVDVNMKSALLIAAYGNYNAFVCLTRDDRVNMDQLDVDGNNVFTCAIISGKLENIKYLLKHPKINVHHKDKTGANAFVLAQNNAIIRILLHETSININTSDKRGFTPLMNAAKCCDDIVIHDFLKDREININASDENGMTAFMYAVKKNSRAVVACFLKDGRVDTNLTDVRGRSALVYGLDNHSKMSLLLNTLRFDVNIKDENGQTVLMHAVIQFAKLTMLLESLTIKLNLVDNYGENALFIAMKRRNEEAFTELVKQPIINARVIDLGIFNSDEEGFLFYAQLAYRFNHGTKQVVDIQHEIARRLEDVNILEFQRTLIKKEDLDEEEEEEVEALKMFHHKKVIELIEKQKVLLLKAFDVNVYEVKSGKTCIGLFGLYVPRLLLLPGINLYKYDYNLTYMHDLIENKDEIFKKAMIRSFPPEIRYLKTMRCKNNEMSKLWIMIDDQPMCYSNPYQIAEIDEAIFLHPCLRTDVYSIILPLEKYASRLLNILFRIEKVPHKDPRLYRLVY